MYKFEKENEKKILLHKKYINAYKNKIFINFVNINKYKYKYIILNYKYFFIAFLIIYLIISLNIKRFLYNKELDGGETLQKKKSRFYLKFEMIKKFNFYIKTCFNSKLFNNIKYPLIKNPKISAIMPIYNGGKYLYNSLSSIQNQKMKEIEIILIDDYSTDNTLIIVEEYMKKDKRIRLIKNKKNKKILYTKSIGALNSNGEYIIQLDQDDIFIREDAFHILYYEAKKYNLEIVQMRDFFKKNFFFNKRTPVNLFGFHLIYPKKNHYKMQPELKDKLFADSNNYLLWCLLIKTDLYKKAIYHLWPLIMNYKIIFNEDYIITSMLANLAKKYKYINKFILIHLMHSKSISNDYFKKKEFYLTLYFYLYYLYTYYVKNSPKNIQIILNYIYSNFSSFSKGKNKFPKMFDFIIKIILNNNYLSLKEKKNFLNKLNIDINNYEYIMNEEEFNNIINYQNIINKSENKNELEKNLIKKNYKITIIIYCSEFKFIKKTIKSIINQINIINEIIIISDSNNEINSQYIKKLIIKYNNIKLIINKKQKGVIYSYSLGVMVAKGEYILSLQPGYILAKENILSNLYNYANENNIDILEFNLLINSNYNIQKNSFNLYKSLHFQLIKDFNIIKNNEKYKDLEQEKEHLFNKLIKTYIYKKIIYEYNLNHINSTIFYYYDNIIIFLLNKYKLKFKHINEFGVIQNKLNNLSLEKKETTNNNKNQLIKDSIFYVNFLFENSENTISDKKYVFQEFINILSTIFNKFSIITKNSIELLEKFIKSKYINIEDKIELQFLYKSLIN